LPNCRALFLNEEVSCGDYSKAIISEKTFEAIIPSAKINGKRTLLKDSVGVIADVAQFPDSFFIGKTISAT
ncbi:MAG: hypothetical protein RR794_03650, partial [Raoultibacter sp.]